MNRIKIKFATLSTIALVAGVAPSGAWASAFYLQDQSTKAAGRAQSGEVADQGAESLWWNPAAIGGQQGGSAHVNLSVILPRERIENINTLIVRPGQPPAPVGGDPLAKNSINNGILPTFALAYGLTPQVAVGLAVTSPFSFTNNYADDSWTRYSADRSRLRTVNIQPSIAVMPLEGLSIGAGLNIEYADANLTNALPNLSPLQPDGRQELKGNGWDLGWSAGVQLRQGPLSLGASYKSSVKHTIPGTVKIGGLLGPLAGFNGNISSKATFRLPWQVTVGGRFAVTPALTLNAQVVRFGWSKFDDVLLGEPINAAIPIKFRNSWNFAGGFDYVLSPRWTIRGGIQRDLSPTRDSDREERIPDASRWNFAGGTSFALSRRLTIDAAAEYIRFKDATLNRVTAAYAGTPAQTPLLIDGQVIHGSVVVLSLGGRVSF